MIPYLAPILCDENSVRQQLTNLFSSIYSRKRRGASNNPTGEGVDEMNEDKYSIDSDNQSALYDENVQSSLSSKIPVIQFRRLQKEVS
ncbi:unnamed protein product [Trichobilharzia regenti]|nr:unnamed protein product [Trichobilharzia regenti]